MQEYFIRLNDIISLIEKLVGFAQEVRRSGLLAIENDIFEINSLDDLLPDETKSTKSTKVKLDASGELRSLVGNIWRRFFHAQRRILLPQSIASSLARKFRPQTPQQNYQVSSL